MLNQLDRERIRACARPKNEDYFPQTENALLAVTVEQLRQQWPEHFHTEQTLGNRVFYNQPKDHVACAGYIVPRKTD